MMLAEDLRLFINQISKLILELIFKLLEKLLQTLLLLESLVDPIYYLSEF
jgi:hypothetical protein